MTKNDIAAELCKRIPGLSKSAAIHVVEAFTDILTDAFTRGEHVYLRGFGIMEVKTLKERTARNIATGIPVFIPAQRTVRIKISSKLKQRMNDK